MEGSDFKESNKVYGKPADMTNEECSALPVCVCKNPDMRYPSLVTKWKLTQSEIKQLRDTGEIEVYVVLPGTQLQPMFLTTHNPFDNFGYVPIDTSNSACVQFYSVDMDRYVKINKETGVIVDSSLKEFEGVRFSDLAIP